MMKNIIIIGGGGHAKVIINIIKKLNNYQILGYTDIKNKGKILGVQYLGNDDKVLQKYINFEASLGLGKLIIDDIRKKIYEKYKNSGVGFPAIIAPTAVINEEVFIEEGTAIMDGVVINSGTRIGEISIINTNSSIDHDCCIGKGTHVAPGVTISGGVKIGDNCIIGVGSIIIQNVEIGNNVFIGAGSLVRKNVTISGTYAGNPIRKIK